MTSIQHMYNVNTSRTAWKHCHLYRVNRGCPCGVCRHMLVTHWSKNDLLRSLPGESKRARSPDAWPQSPALTKHCKVEKKQLAIFYKCMLKTNISALYRIKINDVALVLGIYSTRRLDDIKLI